MSDDPPRVPLARLPTPLDFAQRLTSAWSGPRIWIKRDDLTGFGVSGNKVRKLEFHAGAAMAAGADVLVTCGAVQSNHCRATAIVAARLGLRCRLFLRSADGRRPRRIEGNHRLARLAGARITFVDHDWYAHRDERMAEFAARVRSEGRTAWVIPEGASDAVGMLGYARAAREIEDQLERAGVAGALHWHAASSGGTTAGLAAGLSTGAKVVAASVSDTAADLSRRIDEIAGLAGSAVRGTPLLRVEVRDDYLGLGYGLATPEELATQLEASQLTGLIFDPTYTGKALHGLKREVESGRFDTGDDVVFWHTGGGFAALAFDYGTALDT
jgi:D-cysteine desulfhydrase